MLKRCDKKGLDTIHFFESAGDDGTVKHWVRQLVSNLTKSGSIHKQEIIL